MTGDGSKKQIFFQTSDGVEGEDPPKGLRDGRGRTPKKPSERAKVTAETDDAYACDRKTVRILSYMIEADERSRVDAWLEKLDECADRGIRSQYLQYLLRAVAGGGLRCEPFARFPARGPLRPLGEIVDAALLYGLYARPLDKSSWKKPAPVRTAAVRETFYGNQPKPEDGIFCYAVTFSRFLPNA